MTYTYTIDEFKVKVAQYFKYCKETLADAFPDESGMLNMLAISDEEYALLQDEPEYAKVLLWAKRSRTSWLERNMVVDNKKANGCFNALKQEKNGGYSDRGMNANEKKERKLIVKIEGMQGQIGK